MPTKNKISWLCPHKYSNGISAAAYCSSMQQNLATVRLYPDYNGYAIIDVLNKDSGTVTNVDEAVS